MADIEEELRRLAVNTPEIIPFLRKFQEYLEAGVKIIDAQWGICEDFSFVQRLAGEKKAHQEIIGFLELLIRPPKEEGENETEE